MDNYNSIFKVLWLSKDDVLEDMMFHASNLDTYKIMNDFINDKLNYSRFVALSIKLDTSNNWRRIGCWSKEC